MKTSIQNEQGAASLLYVLLISLVLLVMTPAILLAVSTDSSRNIIDRNSQMAANLSASGMETFIAYLDSYNEATDGDRQVYFNNYSGYMVDRTFFTPEGVAVTYSLIKQETTPGSKVYQVISTTRVGSEGRTREKSVKYVFDAETVITETHVDPDNRVTLPNTNEDIYAQANPYANQTVEVRTDIQQAISNALTYYRSQVPVIPPHPIPNVNTYISALEAQAVTCSCNNLSDIQSIVTNSTNNPTVIRVTNTNWSTWENNSVTLNWGTVAKPVIVIFDGSALFGGNQQININITGDLIVKGDFRMNPQNSNSEVKLNKSASNQYGNLVVLGNIEYYQPARTNVAGTIRANNLLVKAQITAGNIQAAGNITTDSPTTVAVSGTIFSNNYSTKGSVSAGNLVVANDLTATNPTAFTINSLIYSKNISINNSPSTINAGTIYTTNHFYIAQGNNVTTTGNINVNSFSLAGNSTIRAAKLIVKNLLEMSNDTDVILSSDAILGSMTVHTSSTPGITAVNGDILVVNNIVAGNNITLMAGGAIAAGGQINVNGGYGWGASNISSGGGTTSLHLSDSGSSGGNGTSTGAWKPKRSG